MKKIKGRFDLVYSFFLPFCVLVTLLYIFALPQLVQLFQVNWLLIVALIFLFCLPIAGKSADKNKKTNSLWPLYLLLSQLLLNLTVWSFARLISIDPSNTLSMSINITTISLQGGLFPWGFMIFFALALHYVIYRKQKAGLVSSIYQPCFHNTHADSIGVAVDSYMRSVPFCLLTFFLVFFTLSLLFLLQRLWPFDFALGLNFKMIFISCFYLLLISQPAWIKFIHELKYRQFPTIIIFFGISIVLALLFPLLNAMANGLVYLNPLLDISSTSINQLLTANHLQVLIVFFWFGLSALHAAFIAYICRAQTMRMIIISSFLCFFCSFCLILGLENTIEKTATWLPLLLMLACSLIHCVFILKKEWITYFLRATLPTDKIIKARPTFRLFKAAPLVIVALLCSYLGSGAYVWSYLMVLSFLPPLMVIFISFVCWINMLIHDST